MLPGSSLDLWDWTCQDTYKLPFQDWCKTLLTCCRELKVDEIVNLFNEQYFGQCPLSIQDFEITKNKNDEREIVAQLNDGISIKGQGNGPILLLLMPFLTSSVFCLKL